MPSFDLRHIRAAKYTANGEVISYEGYVSVGDAMSVSMELTFAEGRLYAEGSLSEYIKLATGGTISVATKYMPQEAQVLLYGVTQQARQVNGRTVSGLVTSADDLPNDVGLSFYAPDKIDGKKMYTCVFAKRAQFGPPSMNYATRGSNITFNTPTTTGEFLADAENDFFEVAIAETEIDAVTWCDTVLGLAQAATPTAAPAGGEVPAGTAITLTSADGAAIRYTVDGRTPTLNSKLYSADKQPAVNAAMTLKARAFKEGMTPSDILEAAYTLAAEPEETA